MLKFFFILTLRSWMREAKITLINLLGMSMGIAAAILLYLYIVHEYSFEDMHAKRENIHRLYTKVDGQDGGQGPYTSPAIGPALTEEIPEIISFVRIVQHNTSVIHEDKHFRNMNMLMVDSTFFDFFDFDVLEGNPGLALTQPTSLILTQSLADKLFPDQSALNKPIDIGLSEVNMAAGQMDHIRSRFQVGAVVKDPPTNTHLQFNLLAPVYALEKRRFIMGAHIFST